MKRLFFALDIANTDKAKIHKWRTQNCVLPAKAINQSNFHITLAFLGMVTPAQQQAFIGFCDRQLFTLFTRSSTQFHITFDYLGLFTKAQVLYLGANEFSQQLIKLADLLSEHATQLGISQESRRYHPHISLYRKAKNRPESIACQLNIAFDSFSLYHSQSTANGVVYTPLKTWMLVLK